MIESVTYRNPVEITDEEDIIESAKKDPSAFEPLYRKYYAPVFRFILNRTGDKQVTADLTSQVFLNALNKLPEYEFRGFPLSSWLFRIAINASNEYFRKKKKSRFVILDDYAMARIGESIGDDDSDEISPDFLRKVFGTLEKSEIDLIEMRFFEQMSFRTIADILDITENNAKVRLYRILARVRKNIKP